ncbi:MAG: recombinase family protein [Cetobacterium sp.]
MIYGYARVSTKNQKLERQIEALKKWSRIKEDGTIEKIIDVNTDVQLDKFTGTTIHRAGLDFLKRVMRSGDTLVVKEIDRLGRNRDETLAFILELIENQIDIVVIDSPVFQMYIDTMKKTEMSFTDKLIQAQLKGVIEIMLLLAEEERNKIIKRTSEGRKKAVEKFGKSHFGAVKKISDVQLVELKEDIDKFNRREIQQVEILKKWGITRPTFAKYKKELFQVGE